MYYYMVRRRDVMFLLCQRRDIYTHIHILYKFIKLYRVEQLSLPLPHLYGKPFIFTNVAPYLI